MSLLDLYETIRTLIIFEWKTLSITGKPFITSHFGQKVEMTIIYNTKKKIFQKKRGYF